MISAREQNSFKEDGMSYIITVAVAPAILYCWLADITRMLCGMMCQPRQPFSRISAYGCWPGRPKSVLAVQQAAAAMVCLAFGRLVCLLVGSGTCIRRPLLCLVLFLGRKSSGHPAVLTPHPFSHKMGKRCCLVLLILISAD